MTKQRLTEDLANMEEVLERTADRTDIWQDRLIHAMGRAIYDILDELRRQKEREVK